MCKLNDYFSVSGYWYFFLLLLGMRKALALIFIFTTSFFIANSQDKDSKYASIETKPKKKLLKLLRNCIYIPSQSLETEIIPTFDSLSLSIAKEKTVKGFLISNREISNGDYNLFIKYVKDSVARKLMGYVFQGLDGMERIDFKKKIDFEDWFTKEKLDQMILTPERRINKKKEYDYSKLFYSLKINDSILSVPVYPNAQCWGGNQINDLVNESGFLRYDYYSQSPVVGIDYLQAISYCDWKTRELNSKSKHKLIVTLPLGSEWVAAVISGKLQGWRTPAWFKNGDLNVTYPPHCHNCQDGFRYVVHEIR